MRLLSEYKSFSLLTSQHHLTINPNFSRLTAQLARFQKKERGGREVTGQVASSTSRLLVLYGEI